MDPLLKDTLTIGFSSASLLISIITLTLYMLDFRRQGGGVKFDLDYEHKSSTGAFILRVENEGYHSVKINNIRMIAGNRPLPVDHEGFELNYGQEVVVKMSLAGYPDFHPLEINRVEVVDVSGKIYKIKTNKLREKIREMV